jgi:AcrR family transcriptional regulator
MTNALLAGLRWPVVSTTPSTNGRRRRAGADKRLEVLDGIIDVIAERGIENTRFADISSSSGVAVSTLQYWFGSREDMLVEAFLYMNRRDAEQLRQVADLDRDPWERLERLIRFDLAQPPQKSRTDRRAWLEFWSTAVRQDEILVESKQVYDWWRQPFLDAIRDGIQQQMFTPSVPPEAIVTDLMATLDGATIPLLLGHDYFDLTEFVDVLLGRVAKTLDYER